MASLRLTLILALTALLGGCQLFYDSAAPPFIDRLAATRTVDGFFGDLGASEADMHVLDNGSRHFLLLRAFDKSGVWRTVAFDGSLRVREQRTDLWELRNSFVDVNGDFVIGTFLFSGADFSFQGEQSYDRPNNHRVTALLTDDLRLVVIAVSEDDAQNAALRAGPAYDADWIEVTGNAPFDIHPDDPITLNPLNGFELRAAQHDPGRGRSGLVLWNRTIGRFFVIELSSDLAARLADNTYTEEFLTDEAPHIILAQKDNTEIFYTRRGVVVIDRDDEKRHIVYSITSGNRIAEYRFDPRGDYSYAYSPDGRWVYSLDHRRGRLYKASTWW